MNGITEGPRVGNLILCSGYRLNQLNEIPRLGSSRSSADRKETREAMVNRRLSILRRSPENLKVLPKLVDTGNVIGDSDASLKSPNRLKRSYFAGNHVRKLSRMVKIACYSKLTDPYLVIYDSTTKFASPVEYLKLRKCRIISSADASFLQESGDDRTFRIVPEIPDEAITLQAPSKLLRDEWVAFLKPLSKNEDIKFENITKQKARHTQRLPVLEEADEIESIEAFTPTQSDYKYRKTTTLTIDHRNIRKFDQGGHLPTLEELEEPLDPNLNGTRTKNALQRRSSGSNTTGILFSKLPMLSCK